MAEDRFTKISDNYGKLFSEVFSVQGLDYDKFESSIFEQVSSRINDFKKNPILDVGVGDGETSKKFIETGCTNLVGIDLNPQMIKATSEKYGNKIKLIQANATDLSIFQKDQFPIVITGATIHNIPKTERIKFWSEIIRLNPDLIVMGEKIADENPKRYQETYDSEISAIKKVYGERYNLPEAEKEWLDHYKYDEKQKLELSEIKQALDKFYNIEVVSEMGMCKTVVCQRKSWLVYTS